MNKAEIIEILEDWNFWTKTHSTGIRREKYLKELTDLAKTEQIVAILGVRRAGKSTVMLQFIQQLIENNTNPKDILYVNFEDVRFKEFNISLLNDIYETYLEYIQPTAKKPYIFLDEVHKITDWERFARTVHELKKAVIFVSGSNEKLLFGKLASVLTGRHIDLRVFPLSFKEFLIFNKTQINTPLELISKKHQIKSLLNQYMEYGGFPLVCLQERKKEILQTYFNDIINKDIIENYTITHVSKISELAKKYLTNTGRRVSFNKISLDLSLSLDTIERYSYYIEQAYLISFIKKFAYSLKEQEKTMAIVYAADNGLKNLIGFSFSKDYGWLYQNTVANALMQKKGKENIFYWMSTTKEEVDFVIKEGHKIKQLIQVCFNINERDTQKREVMALLKASKELKCNNLLIITEDTEKEEKIKGKTIKYLPLWKWLLEAD